MTYHQAVHDVPLIFEGCDRPSPDERFDSTLGGKLPASVTRAELDLPDIAERDVVKHFINLSQMNFGVDNGLYPLGSCTMKYNPKVCDEIASMRTVSDIHPLQDPSTIQGALRLMYELERMLCEIGGLDAVTLQPAAGAQGEFTGMHLVRAYHEANKETRKEVIVPDTAHGTNPASAAMVGYDVLELPSKEGCVDVEALKSAVSKDTAALMLTNPNTLGLFEKDVCEIAGIVHESGAILYYDGANLNAIMGKTSPARWTSTSSTLTFTRLSLRHMEEADQGQVQSALRRGSKTFCRYPGLYRGKGFSRWTTKGRKALAKSGRSSETTRSLSERTHTLSSMEGKD